MKAVLSALAPAALALSAVLLPAAPAVADVAGPWRVVGDVGGTAFTLDCRFEPHGAALGGVCVEASISDPRIHGGQTHVLTAGGVDGNKVRWAYPASFMIMKFTVSFEGTLDGDRIVGKTAAAGRHGAFTATRK
jgi:hypothetical protein